MGVAKKGVAMNDATKKKISKALKGKPNRGSFKKGVTSWSKGLKRPEISGDKHPNWKGGKFTNKQGYVFVRIKTHTRVDKNGYVKEHVLVAEKALGRFLTKEEVIHHINEVKSDNRLENLYLFESNYAHSEYHSNVRHGNCDPITVSNLI